MGTLPLSRSLILTLLSVFLTIGFGSSSAAPETDSYVAVVGVSECIDCREKNINAELAFQGLHVAVKCKTSKGDYETKATCKLDKNGNFNVQLPTNILQVNGELKQECLAELQSASTKTPCLSPSKIILSSKKSGKHTYTLPQKLGFSSSATCTSAASWPYYKWPPISWHKPYYFPPKPYFPPIYKKPLPPPAPIYKPPVPAYKPPVYKAPVPVYKPPVPVYKPPIYKPPVPVYKPPVYKPPVYKKPLPPPVYKPPVPAYKPPVYNPPVYTKPLPPPVPVYTKPLPPSVPYYQYPFFKKPFPPIYYKPLPPFPKYPPFYQKPWPPIPPISFQTPKYYYKPKYPVYPPAKVQTKP